MSIINPFDSREQVEKFFGSACFWYLIGGPFAIAVLLGVYSRDNIIGVFGGGVNRAGQTFLNESKQPAEMILKDFYGVESGDIKRVEPLRPGSLEGN